MNTDYKNVALELQNYYEQHKEELDKENQTSGTFVNAFKEKFSPERIRELEDSEVLNFIFGDKEDDSLFHNIEFNKNLDERFGRIKGGFSSKRILYKSKRTNNWTNGAKELSIEDATKEALNFRDRLLNACDYISSIELSTLDDYKNLDEKLHEILGKFIDRIFVKKYLYLLYPDYFFSYYKENMIEPMLYQMNIMPGDSYYELVGQIHLIKEESKIPSFAFYDILKKKFGSTILSFYQFDLNDEPNDLIEQSQKDSFLALNCTIKENLSELFEEDNTNTIGEMFGKKYFSGDKKIGKNLAEEIDNFLNPKGNSVFVIKKNGRLLGLFGELGEYEYSPESSFPHRRKGNWRLSFSQDDSLPQEEEKFKITNKENLLFLYNRYFNTPTVLTNSDLTENENTEDEVKETEGKIRFKTSFKSKYPRNLLLFGAPGTGKSFTLNQQKDDLLDSETDYERVTFHPDYSYANFVGTYKPTVDKENNSITYKFVPGPFARIYAKAIKNSKTDDIHPYLLIIEELNRSNAAAVFGDVFQLLDRIDNVSEYSITTSEEFRNYLIEEVGGDEADFESIRLPDNLFIWATMNNADQGVYPIDTAFKRRWEYKPLNINENDSQIDEKYVLLGKNKDQKVEWNKLRKAINEFLSKERINEDKQLGPFFLNLNEISAEGLKLDRESFIETFKNKILIYLFEDAARRIRQKIFSGSQRNYRYSDLCEEFDKIGIKIFDQEIVSQAEPEIISSEELE